MFDSKKSGKQEQITNNMNSFFNQNNLLNQEKLISLEKKGINIYDMYEKGKISKDKSIELLEQIDEAIKIRDKLQVSNTEEKNKKIRILNLKPSNTESKSELKTQSLSLKPDKIKKSGIIWSIKQKDKDIRKNEPNEKKMKRK